MNTQNSTNAVAGVPAPRKGWDKALIGLLVGMGLFLFITMPAFVYPGDNFFPRIECAHWLQTGQLGIPYSMKPQFKGSLDQRGQYFFENDAKQMLFSKYGIGYTLGYLPPLLAEALFTGSRAALSNAAPVQLFIINVYNVLLGLLFLFYLYKVVACYTGRPWIRVVYVLMTCLGTFVWHYLRSPTTEIFQFAPFVGFYYHLVQFLRAQRQAGAGGWGHLAASTAFVGCLLLIKHSHGVLFAVIGLSALLAGAEDRPWQERLCGNLRTHFGRYLLYIGLPAAVFIGVWLSVNAYRCGSPLESGYSQWLAAEGKPVASIDVAVLPASLSGFLLQAGNANLFIHFPILGFALLGWPAFFRRHRFEAVVLGGVVGVTFGVLCCFFGWQGEWCYGPRLLVFILVLAALPLVEVLECWADTWRAPGTWVGVAALALVLAWSVNMQVQMNSLHYFTYHYVSGFFEQFKDPRLKQYFNSYLCRGQLHQQLRDFDAGGTGYFPVEVVREHVRPEQWPAAESQLRGILRQFAKPNYYFFP